MLAKRLNLFFISHYILHIFPCSRPHLDGIRLCCCCCCIYCIFVLHGRDIAGKTSYTNITLLTCFVLNFEIWNFISSFFLLFIFVLFPINFLAFLYAKLCCYPFLTYLIKSMLGHFSRNGEENLLRTWSHSRQSMR